MVLWRSLNPKTFTAVLQFLLRHRPPAADPAARTTPPPPRKP